MIITKKDIKEAAKLTYFDSLDGKANKEEDFRCVFYYHLRHIIEKRRLKDVLILNPKYDLPKRYKKKKSDYYFPDIMICHKNFKRSFIEIKFNIVHGKSVIEEVKEDLEKLKIYRDIEDAKFERGYLIHFYRNFPNYNKKVFSIKSRKISNIFYPNKNDKKNVNKMLKKLKDEDSNRYGEWAKDGMAGVPANSYLCSKREYLSGYKKLMSDIVDLTKNSKKPVRFDDDILKWNQKELEKKLGLNQENKKLKKLLENIRYNQKIRKDFKKIFSSKKK